jgi:hypothetical protein
MLTAQAIEDFKEFLENNIAYAMVTVNGTASKKTIYRKERLADGRVAVYINITPQLQTTATIQRVQLYNQDQQLWADKTENIVLSAVQEGALYRFVFQITEQEV